MPRKTRVYKKATGQNRIVKDHAFKAILAAAAAHRHARAAADAIAVAKWTKQMERPMRRDWSVKGAKTL